jgi:hypothetical protein
VSVLGALVRGGLLEGVEVAVARGGVLAVDEVVIGSVAQT